MLYSPRAINVKGYVLSTVCHRIWWHPDCLVSDRTLYSDLAAGTNPPEINKT